ncbi:bifunctional diaminohydroxyphosphoribosylaminopyrimidine deaminase/5-amino-6-(5-phosphoribosylamino)uracil reductase RibD [Priestia taiwanensis]|uniref:bifunctional diaminohydroxyphosphoribosylaminopyrimidine deaminase/5-amino-6-(5-phosphoribosylamino)uracil reductase RibD n=1 Tax=Priestia taiwanensis TaxID=1347902 RepID=UPI001668D324|nr:bifunctional diaminohydroxyphosphoribosylaminopyrimidine deaminase/5-amino-6-(5-phosphoribosylamino)uracil reductase RibD [Priestia taiwanensis]
MGDVKYMELALQIASATKGQTSPNPVVGAVVVKNGQIVGIGTHLQAGEEHAEVHALRMAGKKAKGSTLYVTLEPCNHVGKTGRCTDLIVENKVTRVVVAMTDPNPLVAGSGITRLRNAGVRVDVGLLEKQARDLNEVFCHFITTNEPFVTLKQAVTLDGKIATASRDSKWITCEEARHDVHDLRHTHDAILVGVNTVIQDNPYLTARIIPEQKQPIRIVLDTTLRTPVESHIVQDKKAPTWIFVGYHASRERIEEIESYGVRVFQLQTKTIYIEDVVCVLGEQRVASLLVEGGQQINMGFLQAKKVNKVITYIAPKIIGGIDSLSSFGGSGVERMMDAYSFQFTSIEQIGTDIKVVTIPKFAKGDHSSCLQG